MTNKEFKQAYDYLEMVKEDYKEKLTRSEQLLIEEFYQYLIHGKIVV